MNLIYVFLDNESKPYYIGKTKNFKQRKRRHLWEINSGHSRLPKYNKARKLIRKGHPFTIVIWEENLTDNEIDRKEIYYIWRSKKDGYKLYNLTGGGEGCSSSFLKKARAKRINCKHSEETKRKISQANKGKSFTAEHKSNLTKAWKKRPPMSVESRTKQSNTAKGSINIKKYRLISPEGVEHITHNGLTLFCEQHNLQSSVLHKVLIGERIHHKGWKIDYAE